MSAADALTKQVGPLPMGVWLLVGAGGLAIAYKSRQDGPELVQDVREVPVPVGAIGPTDQAPVVITPIFRLPDVKVNVAPAPAVVNVNVPQPSGTVSPPVPTAPRTTATPAAPAASPTRTHTVKSGDTLSALAARYYGSWSAWPRIYQANAAKIDGIARSRGKAPGGHWIFPGTVLVIP